MSPLRRFIHAWRYATSVRVSEPTLHTTERMQAMLARERMRSDRGGSSFSLLTFSFAGPRTSEDLTRLAEVFAARVRATDDAGILSSDRVGIILPETPADGAWKLAGDLIQMLPVSLRSATCDVFVYPTHDDSFDLDDEETIVHPATNGMGIHSSAPKDMAVHSVRRRARSMHTMFVRPLPRWKRLLDVVASSLALVILSPLLLAVALAIKVTSPGPVIFRQRRDTIGGQPFMIYKFRTMAVDAEEHKAALRQFSEQDGPAFKIAKDPRVTRLGRFLRSTSIDELPQLVNVLKGEVSLVGPRPLPCDESRNCERWQQRRLDVTPGLTCIWQVRGRSSVSFAEWMRMDLRYIHSRSIANDLKLLLETVPAVVVGRGAC